MAKTAPVIQGRRQSYNRLLSQLMIERSSFDSQWKTISDYVAPTRSRFLVSDANKGHRRNDKINDNTATIAGRVLESGMQSGMTNPATRWFKIQPKNKALRENWEVMDWCEIVEDILYGVLLGSGIYNSFSKMYGDEGHYGTAPILIEEDFETVIRTRVLPVGSYYIAQDARGRVNVFFRVFQMTVRQVVEEIGQGGKIGAEIDWTNISSHVRDLWEGDGKETWIEVCHVIAPNDEYDTNKMESKYKKFRSCLYEAGRSAKTAGYMQDGEQETFLRESGYDYFPVLVARWGVSGEDVYATDCPGMMALGDVKQLQLGERRIMQAIDKQVNPPMNATVGMKSSRLVTLPGEINYLPSGQAHEKFEPVYKIEPDTKGLEFKQDQVRRRINEAYFKPTFVMFSDQPDKQPITAAEVAARQAEKMLQLGPVLERHSQDVYDPAIEITFDMAQRQGIIPPPPVDLEGAPLEVEYVSVLAQAQKAAGIGAVDRFLDFLTRLSVLIKNAEGTQFMDKVDIDDLINDYAARTGVPRKIILSDERVQAIRESRAKAQQQQQAIEAAPQVADTVKTLSEAKLDEDSALSRIVQGAQRNSLVGAN